MTNENLVLEKLKELLKGTEYEGRVFLAGGAVRDEIMGQSVKDIDVVVSMPDGGIKFAEWLTRRVGSYREGKNPVIYPRFGTAKFNLRGLKVHGVDVSDVDIESVMTRGEKYEKGSRKPSVVYADLKEDAFRRDLTVNSLFKDLVSGEIKDLTGRGLADIKEGVVRTPLDPDITFKDDPLRMLRTVRFAVKYNWKMPLSLVKALKANSHLLSTISKERIQDEFNKILMTKNPDKGLRLLVYTGLNDYIIPELNKTRGVTQNQYHKDDVFDHILEVVKNTEPDLIARLAAVFHDIAKPQTRTEDETGIHFYQHEDFGAEIAARVLKDLKYSTDTIESVKSIVANHMRLKPAGDDGSKISDKAVRKFVVALGGDLNSALKLMHADNISHSEAASMPNQIPALRTRIENLFSAQQGPVKPTLPIGGRDVMAALNIKPGPHIKDLLDAVTNAWYENPDISREEALHVVKQAYYAKVLGPLLRQKIRNPETNNMILVRSALQYDKTRPAYKAARHFLKIRIGI